MLDSPIAKLALLGAAVYVAWKYGNSEVRIAALGVAGYVVANQLPFVRDGLQQRAVA